MNCTHKQLQQRVNEMIKQQGEDAHVAAWIYSKEDICRETEDGDLDYFALNNPVLVERVFGEVGNKDHIYTEIQECVDEVSEEQYVLYQQELEDESPLVQ